MTDRPFGRDRSVFRQLADIQTLLNNVLDETRGLQDYFETPVGKESYADYLDRRLRGVADNPANSVQDRLKTAEFKYEFAVAVMAAVAADHDVPAIRGFLVE